MSDIGVGDMVVHPLQPGRKMAVTNMLHDGAVIRTRDIGGEDDFEATNTWPRGVLVASL